MYKKILVILYLSASLTSAGQAREVSIETQIQGLYIAYFNRAADKNGLDFWRSRAAQSSNNKTILKELSAGFSKHPTFSATYAHLSNRAFVEAIYRNVLGKDGDSSGIDFWTQTLDRGVSRSDIVSDFVEASLTSELTPANFPHLSTSDLAIAQQRQDLITNKTLVAESFTTSLGLYSNIENTSHPENDPAYLASIAILADINEEISSVSEKINYLSSIINTSNPIAEINGTANQGGNDNSIPVLSSEEISDYLNAINQARAVQQNCHSKGIFPAVAPLSWNNKLYQAAYEHSYDLATSNTFSHTGSGTATDWTGVALGKPSSPGDRIEHYHYNWRGYGENIAAGTFTNTATIAVQQWLDSDGHCANLMSSNHTEVGMAMVYNASSTYTHYWTQNFGTQ